MIVIGRDRVLLILPAVSHVGEALDKVKRRATREKLLFSQSGMIERYTGPLEESLSQIRTTLFGH